MTFVPAPLRERDFRLLFAGRTISMFGSAMAPVALAFAILNTLHGHATDVGYVLAARQGPWSCCCSSAVCGATGCRAIT